MRKILSVFLSLAMMVGLLAAVGGLSVGAKTVAETYKVYENFDGDDAESFFPESGHDCDPNVGFTHGVPAASSVTGSKAYQATITFPGWGWVNARSKNFSIPSWATYLQVTYHVSANCKMKFGLQQGGDWKNTSKYMFVGAASAVSVAGGTVYTAKMPLDGLDHNANNYELKYEVNHDGSDDVTLTIDNITFIASNAFKDYETDTYNAGNYEINGDAYQITNVVSWEVGYKDSAALGSRALVADIHFNDGWWFGLAERNPIPTVPAGATKLQLTYYVSQNCKIKAGVRENGGWKNELMFTHSADDNKVPVTAGKHTVWTNIGSRDDYTLKFEVYPNEAGQNITLAIDDIVFLSGDEPVVGTGAGITTTVMDQNRMGLRFHNEVTVTKDSASGNEYVTVGGQRLTVDRVGCLAAPEGREMVRGASGVKDTTIKTCRNVNDDEATHLRTYSISVIIKNIPQASKGNRLSTRAYIVCHDNDGHEYTLYGNTQTTSVEAMYTSLTAKGTDFSNEVDAWMGVQG